MSQRWSMRQKSMPVSDRLRRTKLSTDILWSMWNSLMYWEQNLRTGPGRDTVSEGCGRQGETVGLRFWRIEMCFSHLMRANLVQLFNSSRLFFFKIKKNAMPSLAVSWIVLEKMNTNCEWTQFSGYTCTCPRGFGGRLCTIPTNCSTADK